MDALPRPGDEVEVPWGPGTVRGRVLRVDGPKSRPHVLVEVYLGDPETALEDADEAELSTVSFPAALVKRPAAA